MTFDTLLLVVAAILALIVVVPLAIMVVFLTWPLLLLWHLGHPVAGVIAMLIWWAAAR